MLKLVLEIMLSQKLAALFAIALMVFASQGVIGRPSPQVVGDVVGEAETIVASAIGGIVEYISHSLFHLSHDYYLVM